MLCDRNGYLDGTVYEIIEIIGGHASSPDQRGIILCPVAKETNLSGLFLIKSDRGTYLLITDQDEFLDGIEFIFGIFVPQGFDIDLALEEIKDDFGKLSTFVEDANSHCCNRYLFECLAEDPDSFPRLDYEDILVDLN